MNIKRKKLWGSICLSMAYWSVAQAFDSQFVIIDEIGNVSVFSESNGHKQLTPINMVNRLREGVGDAYCAPQDKSIYVATNNGNLFEIDLSHLTAGYQQICTSNYIVLRAWYNCAEKRPAWLWRGDNNTPSSVQFSGKDGQVYSARPNDICFHSQHVFSMHIHGRRSSAEIAARNADHARFLTMYPEEEWIISGRSKKIEVYGLRIAERTKDGEQFKGVYLFHDRTNGKWLLKELDEFGTDGVFNDVAVVRGMYDVKGDREPDTGNQIQQEPTGNWYFYSPDHHELARYKFDPSWTVPYASAEYAIVVGGGKLMRLPLWKPGVAEPEVLAELPQNFVVAAVCPVLEDAENTEGTFQGQPQK